MNQISLQRLVLAVVFIFLYSSTVLAQSISGIVLDAKTGEPLAGVNILVKETTTGTATALDGSFTLTLPEGAQILKVSYVGYQPQEVAAQPDMRILMEPALLLEEIIIKGVRADNTDPVTQSTISRKRIEAVYNGEQPIFYLEELSPSITAYSESGTKLVNGGYMRLRGISQERINITLNGVPLNDMIDHGVFFSNFTDISGGFESVQVQRGVGTSSNGLASYAGSINFESVNLEQLQQGGSLEMGIGAYNTVRLNTKIASGLIDNKWSFFGSYSKILSDGYRDHTSTNAYSFFFSGGYFGEKDLIKINAFDARSRNGLGYLEAAESDIKVNPRINYLNEHDKDDFGQRFVQLQHIRTFSEQFSTSTSLYYGGAGGDYFYTYVGSDASLQQINYPLRNDHYGMMVTGHYATHGLEVSSGVHTYFFDRVNEESVSPGFENPYYHETSSKTEVSWFAKADYQYSKWSLTADLQMRTMELRISPDYEYIGRPSEGDIIKNWTFWSPRVGVSYRMSNHFLGYASVGRTGREPTKIDIFGGFNLGAVNYAQARANSFNPEYVTDVEAGVKVNYQALALTANFFFMDFKDEISPIGEILDFGIQRRENIADSYRSGVEVEWRALPLPKLTYTGSLTYMKGKIKEFTDADLVTHTNVEPILTPNWIANQKISYTVLPGLSAGVSARYVGESYLGLANLPNNVLPASFVTDVQVQYEAKPVTIKLDVNNLTDELYYSSGVPAAAEGGEPGYFVNAGRNVFLTVKLNF